MAKNKYTLSDEQWEKIKPFIPARENTHPRGGGRKPKDDRIVFEAILFVLRFRCRWNALNATGLCPSSTVHDRFQKWAAAGVFHQLWQEGLLGSDPATKGIDWSWLSPETAEKTPAAGKRRVSAKQGRSWRERRQNTLAERYSQLPLEQEEAEQI